MSNRSMIRTSLSLLAALLLVAYVAMGSFDDRETGNTESTAVFTGTFVDGMPMYRFPPIEVVGHRKSDVASRARQDSRSRAGAV